MRTLTKDGGRRYQMVQRREHARIVILPQAGSPPPNYFLWKSPKDAPFTNILKGWVRHQHGWKDQSWLSDQNWWQERQLQDNEDFQKTTGPVVATDHLRQSDHCCKAQSGSQRHEEMCTHLQTWLTGHSVLRSKIVGSSKECCLIYTIKQIKDEEIGAGGNCPIKVLVSRSEPVLKTINHWLKGKKWETRPQWEHLKHPGSFEGLSGACHSKQKCQLLSRV